MRKTAKPASGYAQRQAKRDRKKAIKRAVAVIVVALVAAAAIGFVISYFTGVQMDFDPNAKNGFLSERTETEMEALRQQPAPEDGIAASIRRDIPVSRDGVAGLGIEHYPGNESYLKVSIALVESGTVVYESGVIRQGQFVESAKLSRELAPGVYDAAAVFTAISSQTGELVGQEQTFVSLMVQE